MDQGEPADDEATGGRDEPRGDLEEAAGDGEVGKPAGDSDVEEAAGDGEVEEAAGDGEEAGREPVAVAIDEAALYAAVRRAVEDAILGVIGTLLLVGVALVLVWVGGAMAFSSGAAQPVAAVAGLVIALIGVYIAASALEVLPPVAEWF